MGQAKQRGTLVHRANEAKTRVEMLRPAALVCNHCKSDITTFDSLDVRNMKGITAAFGGLCQCGNTTIAMRGEPEAVAIAMETYQEVIGHEGIIGSQKLD